MKTAVEKKPKKKRSTKGALIKGMTKKLPSEILANPVFTKHLKEIMRGYAGIYALYNKGCLYYVGLTTNLFGRIKWHLKDRHARKWDQFVIFRIKRISFLKDIETLITQLIDSPGNRVKGKVPRDADINHLLKDILRQHSKEMTLIKKAISK